tara:strand:- start:7344 stop:8414 length:1071 start_codon:yes stop_codon:yes gene_type:complete
VTNKAAKRKFILLFLVIAIVAIYSFETWWGESETVDVTGSNGRIEATEVAIAAKAAGRVEQILVDEGDFVEAGQVVAYMDSKLLDAQLRQALAQLQQAKTVVSTANILVAQRNSEKLALRASLKQSEAELAAAKSRAKRTDSLAETGAVSQQAADDNETAVASAEAAVSAAKAQLSAGDAAIASAEAQVESAKASFAAAQATVEQVQSELSDMKLVSPRSGRVQYRVVQDGEIVSAGGRVLSLIDLTDVYMTFFLPATQAGLLSIGGDVRIVLEAAPQIAIPAKISYVADVAQFTPKTVETESEREKLVFKIKAKIAPELLQKHIKKVKTGLPGVAWVKLKDDATWPDTVPVTVSL